MATELACMGAWLDDGLAYLSTSCIRSDAVCRRSLQPSTFHIAAFVMRISSMDVKLTLSMWLSYAASLGVSTTTMSSSSTSTRSLILLGA